MVDIADWIAVNPQLAKAMGFSRLSWVRCIKQQPHIAIFEASTSNPQGLPHSNRCNLVGLHQLCCNESKACWCSEVQEILLETCFLVKSVSGLSCLRKFINIGPKIWEKSKDLSDLFLRNRRFHGLHTVICVSLFLYSSMFIHKIVNFLNLSL